MKSEDLYPFSLPTNSQQDDDFTITYHLYVGKVYRHCLSSPDQYEMTQDSIQAIFARLLSQPGRLGV